MNRNILQESKNRELAKLMIRKRSGKLKKGDKEKLEQAITGFNARAAANRKRMQATPVDWDSGKDSRAEAAIRGATQGVKKTKKGEVKAAAKAHGEKVDEGRKRLKRVGDAIIKKSGGIQGTDFEDPHFGKEARNEKDGDKRNTGKKIRRAFKTHKAFKKLGIGDNKEYVERMARRKEKFANESRMRHGKIEELSINPIKPVRKGIGKVGDGVGKVAAPVGDTVAGVGKAGGVATRVGSNVVGRGADVAGKGIAAATKPLAAIPLVGTAAAGLGQVVGTGLSTAGKAVKTGGEIAGKTVEKAAPLAGMAATAGLNKVSKGLKKIGGTANEGVKVLTPSMLGEIVGKDGNQIGGSSKGGAMVVYNAKQAAKNKAAAAGNGNSTLAKGNVVPTTPVFTNPKGGQPKQQTQTAGAAGSTMNTTTVDFSGKGASKGKGGKKHVSPAVASAHFNKKYPTKKTAVAKPEGVKPASPEDARANAIERGKNSGAFKRASDITKSYKYRAAAATGRGLGKLAGAGLKAGATVAGGALKGAGYVAGGALKGTGRAVGGALNQTGQFANNMFAIGNKTGGNAR